MDSRNVPALIVRIFCWVSWISTGVMNGLTVLILHGGGDWSWVGERVDVFAAIFVVGPAAFSLALRFVALPKAGNVWVKLALFLMAMFGAYFGIMCGIFLIPEFMGMQCVLSALVMLVWFPQLIRLKSVGESDRAAMEA